MPLECDLCGDVVQSFKALHHHRLLNCLPAIEAKRRRLDQAASAGAAAAATAVVDATAARRGDDVRTGAALNAEAEARAQSCVESQEELEAFSEELNINLKVLLAGATIKCVQRRA